MIILAMQGYCQPSSKINISDQSLTVFKQLETIKQNTAQEVSIALLRKMLTLPNLTVDETLAIQTTLVQQYQELQKWDSCLSYCQQQIVLAHQQKNTLAEATFYKSIGSTYYFIPEKIKAVEYWNKCIEISEVYHYNNLLEQCYHNVGVIYLENGVQFNLAEKYLQQALRFGLSNHEVTSKDNNMHRRLLATLYERTNQLGKAEILFKEVINNCEITKDTSLLAETLMFYSRVLLKKKDFKKALQMSEKALDISRKTNSIDLICTSLTLHAGNLHEAGNDKEAYQYENELNSLIAKRFSGDLNSKISEAEATFKTSEIEHEKDIAAVKGKKEKQIYLLGFATFLSVTGFVFYYLYQKRNVNQKIQMQLQMQEEKERLSRDLHDNLGSQLALLSNNIESLDINFKKQQLLDENIEKVKGTSRQLLQTLRETIWILNKDQVTAPEFFDKLVNYAQRYLQSYPDIELQVIEDFPKDKILQSNEALQLFRICQEAITNSAKYSKSSVLLLQGCTNQHLFEITIRDFGKGFDVSRVNEDEHYGLKNMEKRAESVHAKYILTAEAGKGVTIEIKI
jgi:signal transduction histidine kinase